MLKHADIWRAIDLLAEHNGLSPSGLAKKAGLSSTAFNPSKRNSGARKRWPSTESVARILQATDTSPEAFIALATSGAPGNARLPLLGYAEAGKDGYFDDAGYPTGKGWDEIALPGAGDPHAFALEISGRSMEPAYREGDIIVVSPSSALRRGDRVALRTRGGEVMVKQLGREGGQRVELMSLNPDYPPITLARREIVWLYRVTWASQ